MGEIEAMSKAYVIRIGVCVLAVAVCCGCVAVRQEASEDARERIPQLSADQEEYPLTEIMGQRNAQRYAPRMETSDPANEP
jgi:hypothetical protein